MDNVLICPSKIFITEDLWNDESFRENYLIEMMETFEIIDKSKQIKLIWSIDLENKLWENNKYRPWSEYTTTRNQIIPIIYNFFNKNIIYSEINEQICIKTPDFELNDNDILKIYSQICNEKILSKEDFTLIISKNENYFISSTEDEYLAEIFKTNFDILKKYLDKIINSEDVRDVFQTIELYLKSKNLKRLNKYSFSSNFIKKMKKLGNEDLDRLFERLALRLSYTSAEARSCILLRDKYIDEDNGFRMRITNRPTSKRVHYKIEEDSIKFTEYYGIGEHDDGLQ